MNFNLSIRCKYYLTHFRTPRRRSVRQRSGYKASGQTTGGEAKLVQCEYLEVKNNILDLHFEKEVELVSSFQKDLAFIGFGGYLYAEKRCIIEIELEYHDIYGYKIKNRKIKDIQPNIINKFGIHIIFSMSENHVKEGTLLSNLKITNKTGIGKINFWGIDIDAIDYYRDKDIYDVFKQKTSIYLPEIYYFDVEDVFGTEPIEYNDEFKKGKCIVLKSCNRCTRFLPIDIENERNTISFSNHCVSRAPCNHSLFSSLKVIENNCDAVPNYIKKITINTTTNLNMKENITVIKTYYGNQLECRTCKKYYVNAPLNPMRNTTQHREDSLRRRAIEVLVDELLDYPWIYHKFRRQKRKEFDIHIWNKFNKRCYKCNKELKNPSEMHLDHTMPLSSLWPLDESATCLCSTCNSQKRDMFPIDFYSKHELEKLSDLTNLDIELLNSRQVNIEAVNELQKKVIWFFDNFLARKDYQKIRSGKKTADLILVAVQDAVNNSETKFNLVKEYKKRTGKYPRSISL